MRDAVVRTVVPFVVGLLVTLAAQAGLDLPEGPLNEIMIVVVGGLYYIAAHWIERNVHTRFGQVLLSAGTSHKTPEYRNRKVS